MSQKRWIALSLGLHLLLVFGISRLSQFSHPQITAEPIQISIVQSDSTPAIPKRPIRQLLPKGLGLRPKPLDPLGLTEKPLAAGEPDGQDDEVIAFTAPVQTLGDAVELDPFYAELWKNLSAAISYPEDFAKNRISGSVHLRLEVDHRGVITDRKIFIESEHSYLETLALYSTVAALSKPLHPKYWINRKTTNLTININYVARTLLDDRNENPGGVAGHHLQVSKYAYVKPKLQEKIEKYLVILPMPGGFYVDFVRVYMLIKESMEPDPDELRSFRVKTVKEQLQRELKKMPARQESTPTKGKPLDNGADLVDLFVPVS